MSLTLASRRHSCRDCRPNVRAQRARSHTIHSGDIAIQPSRKAVVSSSGPRPHDCFRTTIQVLIRALHRACMRLLCIIGVTIQRARVADFRQEFSAFQPSEHRLALIGKVAIAVQNSLETPGLARTSMLPGLLSAPSPVGEPFGLRLTQRNRLVLVRPAQPAVRQHHAVLRYR